MRVALVQHDICWESRDDTLGRVAPMVASAVDDGARLVVLPEMFAVGFSMATDRVAEPPEGPTTAWLVDRAASHGAWMCGSIPVRPPGADRPRNTFTLAGPGGELHRYEKRHPFTYAEEDRHYAPGDDAPTWDVEGIRLSPAVCYDLRFADQFWAQGPTTDLYVIPANWPAARREHWRALLRARAIENQAYVVGVNRVGAAGDGLAHAGDSVVHDPLGDSLVDAGDRECVVAADVDPAVVADVRARFPFLQDRR